MKFLIDKLIPIKSDELNHPLHKSLMMSFQNKNKIVLQSLKFLIQNVRLFSKSSIILNENTMVIATTQSNEFAKNNGLIKQINQELIDSDDKSYYLKYFNNLYKQYRQLIHIKNIENYQMFVITNSNINIKNGVNINTILNEVNEHENYNRLVNKHLMKHFSEYTSKEIAFIFKLNHILSIKSNLLDKELYNYCSKSINQFDLYDLENLSLALSKAIDFNFMLSKHIANKLFNFDINQEQIAKRLIIEHDEDDTFERKMKESDVERNYLWLKLNLFYLNKKYIKAVNNKEIANLFFKHSASKLNCDKNSIDYEINYYLNMFSCCHAVDEKDKNFKIRAEYLNFYKNHIDYLLQNFDRFEYKVNQIRVLRFLTQHQLLTDNRIDFLIDYFRKRVTSLQNKQKDDKTSFEFDHFNSIYLLDYLLTRKSASKVYRNTAVIPSDLIDDNNPLKKNVNIYYKNLSKILLNKQEREAFLSNTNRYLENTHPFTFKTVIKSLYFINQMVDSPNTIKKVYEIAFKIIKNLNLDNYSQKDYLLTIFKPLVEISNSKLTKQNELKLCSLIKLNEFYSTKFEPVLRNYLILYFMINEETCIENFEFISNVLLNNIFLNNRYMKDFLLPLTYLLNKHCTKLLSTHKDKFLEIFSILYRDCTNNLNNELRLLSNFDVKSHDYLHKLCKQLIDQEVQLNSDDKYKTAFKYAQYIDLDIDLNKINYVMEDTISEINFDSKIKELSRFLLAANYYSLNNLSQLWQYLIGIIEFLLSINELTVRSKAKRVKSIVKNIINTMNVFTQYDFVKTDYYKQTIRLFTNLNRQFYKRFIQNSSLTFGTQVVYCESLLALNCFVESAFDDLIKLQVSMIFNSMPN